jgi:DNA-directed RNA polymerase subunit RPC12/RpoP
MADAPVPQAPVVLQVPVITVDRVQGQLFVDTVCGGAQMVDVRLDGVTVRLTLLVLEHGREDELREALTRCDAAALLVHHVDAVSIEGLKAAYRLMPSEHRLPSCILILREPGKVEFKMSCPTCGQKLWVRDEDKGRPGRCPHCKKSFVLPAQSAHLQSVLMLPAAVPLVTVTQGNAGSCRGPVAALAERARHRAQVLMSATMRVQVNEDGTSTQPGQG